jgi:hypothetical protein
MQHLEGSGTPVLYIGRTVLKVNSTTSICQRRFLLLLFICSVRINRHVAYGTANEWLCFYQGQCQRRHLQRHTSFVGRQARTVGGG